jgi:preprotein translocase subunit SecE
MFKRVFNQAGEFIKDMRSELKKVTFPSRAETMGSTAVVIVFVFMVGAFLAVVDTILVKIVSRIIQ